jgi:hypothetical protein
MRLRRARVVGGIFAAALAHVLSVVMPSTTAVKNLGVGLWRPCQGHYLGKMLRAMVRIGPGLIPVTPRSTTKLSPLYALQKKNILVRGERDARSSTHEITKYSV